MQTTEQETPVTTAAEPMTTEATPEPPAEAALEPPAEATAPLADAAEEPFLATTEATPERRPFEQWARQKRTDPGDLMRTKVFRRWAVGRYVTEAEFDAAVTDARKLVFR